MVGFGFEIFELFFDVFGVLVSQFWVDVYGVVVVGVVIIGICRYVIGGYIGVENCFVVCGVGFGDFLFFGMGYGKD